MSLKDLKTVYWNPWHGCKKISEGCLNCYVYTNDSQYGKDASVVHKTGNFNLPKSKTRDGKLKIESGSYVYVCLNSDFFIEEADDWRDEAWWLMSLRKDCLFIIITKRADRIEECLPKNWPDDYNNVVINITTENQKQADTRLPIILDLNLPNKGITVAPMLERVELTRYLEIGEFSLVSVSGESYAGARTLEYDWVLDLKDQCVKTKTNFLFFKTGSRLLKSGKLYNIRYNDEYTQAIKAGINYIAL